MEHNKFHKFSYTETIFLIIFFLIAVLGNNRVNFDSPTNIFNNFDNYCEKKPLTSGFSAPSLLSPVNQSTLTSNIVKFDWSDVGSPSDAVFYEFMMDNDSSFSSPEVVRFALNDWSNSTLKDEPYVSFLAHFDNSLLTADGETPSTSSGVSFAPGKFGTGVFVNASANAALAYDILDNLNKNGGTIEFWVQLEQDIDDITDYLAFFDYIMKISPMNQLGIFVQPSTDQVYVTSSVNGTNYYLVPYGKTNWNAGEWHHICLTWGNEMARLYLDGIEEAASTYFPIGAGTDYNRFYIGSMLGVTNWLNATFDEMRISSIQRLPLWKPQSANVNVSYFGLPIQRYPIWNLNESEYTHMFERDGTYYWRVRARNSTTIGEWSLVGNVIISRTLNVKNQVSVKLLDIDGDPIPNAKITYNQTTLSKIMGVDANYVQELLEQYYKWYQGSTELEFYDFLRSRQSNSFRTRLWTNFDGINSLGNATLMAKWAQGNGSTPYLTIFLSDDWADVNKAPIPKIFEGLTFENMLTEITEYCANITSHFIDAGVNMEFYEIGNEIDFGICGVYANDSMPRYNLTWLRQNTWYNESRIIKAAIAGVRQIDPTSQFMLHIAISDPAFSVAFYDAMRDFGVDYDIIGLSYHPVANGDASENGFLETVKILTESGLPGSDHIILPETSYSSKPDGSSYFNWNKSITEFPLTPTGQKNWILHSLEWCYQHPNVIGINYWSPEFYHAIWEGFSWFNSTGHSKIAVEAFPEFFNSRNVSISGFVLSDNEGIALIDAYRGKIQLNIQVETHEESRNLTISPFRDNIFTITLDIDIPTETEDDDDDTDEDEETPAIPGYSLLFMFVIVVGFISLIAINWKKIKEGSIK